MIELTYYTQIKELSDAPSNFPAYAYKLVPFTTLPSYVGRSFVGIFLHTHLLLGFISFLFNFLLSYYPVILRAAFPFFFHTADVIGAVVGVSNSASIQGVNQNVPTIRRILILQDARYITRFSV